MNAVRVHEDPRAFDDPLVICLAENLIVVIFATVVRRRRGLGRLGR
jgi:hypothetical protein